ncbi:disease resistance protein RUN1-like [Nymphaea colorata]|nr:disease resistance protein RUN1-like [Nymphaea colorata]
MEGATEQEGVCSDGCGAGGTKASSQTSQRDDTRKRFIGYLYDTLVKRGISAFIDNVNLKKERSISALEKNEELKEDVSDWKNALREEVNPKYLFIGDYPTDLNSRINEVIKRFDREVRMVGICGMGGIGKTTLAKAVYNRLLKQHNVRENCSSFEKCSFLANVREVSKQHNGNEILVLLLGRDVRINNKDEGITMIRERIGGMKVLVVLDDVDHKDQLDVLVGGGQHAFEQPEPKSGWRGELSEKVVSIAGGIPLCLQVFGSLFSDIESIEEWESKLEQVKRDQHKDVHVRVGAQAMGIEENGMESEERIRNAHVGREHHRGVSRSKCDSLVAFSLLPPQEGNYSQTFSQLKVLILKNCKNLKSTPDFRLIPNATKLVFEGCAKLGQVHESIGDLRRLVRLNLGDCHSLKKIPDSIYRLSSLEKLILSGCWSLGELPEEIGRLMSLKVFQLGQGYMQRLPQSVGLLTNLQELEVMACVHLKTIPDIPNLQALRYLGLSGSRQLMDVPGLSKLRCLESLQLDGCDALRDLNDMMKTDRSEEVIRIVDVRFLTDIGAFIPRKLEDDKGKGVMATIVRSMRFEFGYIHMSSVSRATFDWFAVDGVGV